MKQIILKEANMTYIANLPSSLQDLESKGWEALQNNKFEEAAEYYKQCTEIQPNYASAWFGWGVAEGRLNNVEEAIIKFTIAYNYNRKMSVALYNEAFYRIELQEYSTAIRLLNKAIDIKDKNPDFFYLLGFAYHQLNELLEAIQSYNKTIQLNNNHLGAYFDRGIVRLKLNDTKKAAEDFQKVLQLNPSLTAARVWLQRAQQELRDKEHQELS